MRKRTAKKLLTTLLALPWLFAAAAALAAPAPAVPAVTMPDPNVSAAPQQGTWTKAKGSVPAEGMISIPVPGVTFSDYIFKEEMVGGQPVKQINIPWIAQYITGAYKYAVGIAGVIAAVMMMIGGFLYLTAGGDASKVAKGKERISDAVLGLTLVLGTYMILSIINPDLVSLGGLNIASVKQTLFVANETDISKYDPADYAGAGPASNVKMFKQCSSTGKGIPYTNSNSPKCANDPGKGTPYTVCSSGCGVSSASMIIGFYTNRDPGSLIDEVTKMATDNGGRSCNPECTKCGGTAFQPLMDKNDKTFGKYGLKGEWANDQGKIIDLLKQGKPVIVLVGPSIFTSGGHYIVLTGIDPSGKIIVNDPFLSTYKKNSATGAVIDPPITDGKVPPELIFPYMKVGIYLHPK